MIKVIDSIMGSGKTSFIIQRINKNPERSYVFVTPFLSEVQRIKIACPAVNFAEPLQLGLGKLDSFHKLLIEGRSIVTTHALFRSVTEETRQLLESHNYVLIIDEALEVLEDISLKKDDLPFILDSGLAHVDERGNFIWDQADYDGRFNDLKAMAPNKSLIVIDGTMLMWTFPADIFDCFSEIYVLAYMFEAQIQKYYFQINQVPYTIYKVYSDGDGYSIREHDFAPDDTSKIKINVYEGRLNEVGDRKTALSKSWYDNASKERIQVVKNNTYNFYHNVTKTPSNLALWTCFKENKNKLKGKGYASGHLALNARAVNDYMDRTALAYLINRYLRPSVNHFFNMYGVKVDIDAYALSELLQWIFRSAIRQGMAVDLYLPSMRMRGLLENWLQPIGC